jgi:hypothetical protein
MTRRGQSVGGMQSASLSCSLVCGKCGRDAGRREVKDGAVVYMHFSKAGVYYHAKDLLTGTWKLLRKFTYADETHA